MTLKNLTLVIALALFAIVPNNNEYVKAAEASEDAPIKKAAGNVTENKNMQASEAPPVNVCGDKFTDVSIIQLIANPEKFDGKCVLLVGFAHFEFEGDAIYLHEDDYEYGLTKNGLWLSVSEDRHGKEMLELNNKYVLVEGTFNAKNKGHFDLASGAIEKITRLELWVIKRAEKVGGEDY